MTRQRLIFVTTVFTFYLNTILKVNGQITSCYVGTTYTNDIGTTLIENCTSWGTPPHTACRVSFYFYFNELFIMRSFPAMS